MIGIGIDIGSTAAKAAVVDGEGLVAWTCVQPTGFSSVDAAERLRGELAAAGYDVAADLARSGEPTKISSMCTVFAESEVISLIGRGEPRENIARGVIESVASRVATMASQAAGAPYYLTGGLCENAYVVERLGALVGSPVTTSPQARFAGAIGAAIRAQVLA